ncbi:MAG: sugar transferase [Candidatus Magnetominusculus sp. LBB02]|nr:sugar transferase [Candidatus Magnetominusculus sp. LBB02]
MDKGQDKAALKCGMKLPYLEFTDEMLPGESFYRSFVKPLYDKVFALFLFISASPLLLLIALLVKLDSAGPVIFKQKRVGLFGRVFTIYKFRSMRASQEADANPFTEKNDPRLTRIGKIIRNIRMDELPQLWNVLKGDMSLIGPRPEQVEVVKQLDASLPKYSIRHVIKPGITGLAQVEYKYTANESDVPKKLQYDFYYIKNMSLKVDLYIMLATLKVVLSGQDRSDL